MSQGSAKTCHKGKTIDNEKIGPQPPMYVYFLEKPKPNFLRNIFSVKAP